MITSISTSRMRHDLRKDSRKVTEKSASGVLLRAPTIASGLFKLLNRFQSDDHFSILNLGSSDIGLEDEI